jgi:hypothetical protein
MTHLPNEVALKMDGAQACDRCPTHNLGRLDCGVGGRGGGSAA